MCIVYVCMYAYMFQCAVYTNTFFIMCDVLYCCIFKEWLGSIVYGDCQSAGSSQFAS